MLIPKSTFKQGYLYKIVFSDYFYYSIVVNLNKVRVIFVDVPDAELDIGQTYDEGFWGVAYGVDAYFIDIIEVGPVLTYGEQIKLHYPELQI